MRFQSHKKRLKNVRGSEDTFEPGSLALPKAQPCSAPNVRFFSSLNKSIRFIIPPRPLGLRSKTRLLVFKCFMHSQLTMFAFFRCKFLLQVSAGNFPHFSSAWISQQQMIRPLRSSVFDSFSAHTTWPRYFPLPHYYYG